jgi:hypothetical protein
MASSYVTFTNIVHRSYHPTNYPPHNILFLLNEISPADLYFFNEKLSNMLFLSNVLSQPILSFLSNMLFLLNVLSPLILPAEYIFPANIVCLTCFPLTCLSLPKPKVRSCPPYQYVIPIERIQPSHQFYITQVFIECILTIEHNISSKHIFLPSIKYSLILSPQVNVSILCCIRP